MRKFASLIGFVRGWEIQQNKISVGGQNKRGILIVYFDSNGVNSQKTCMCTVNRQ